MFLLWKPQAEVQAAGGQNLPFESTTRTRELQHGKADILHFVSSRKARQNRRLHLLEAEQLSVPKEDRVSKQRINVIFMYLSF